jgi:HK97 family phage prohead protease
MSSSVERRFLTLDQMPAKLRVSTRKGGGVKFSGYAARYSSASSDLGGFREVLAPGAFDKVLSRRAKSDVILAFNHNPDHLLARTSSKTLRLASDEKGLKFSADPPDTQLARDIAELMKRGDLTGASFAFTVSPKNEAWSTDERGNSIRTIREVSELFDVSIVTTPAYPATSIAMRSLRAWQQARAMMGQAMPASDDQGEDQDQEQHEDQAAGPGLTISVDYDDTFSAAPGLWLSFIEEACEAGNTVILTSRREDTPENQAQILAAIGEGSYLSAVILAGPDSTKRDAAMAAGFEVDIWIDDEPSTVDGPLESQRSASIRIGARLAASRAIAGFNLRRILDRVTR